MPQIITLPAPLESGIRYDRVKIEHVSVDEPRQQWTFIVYGIPEGSNDAMPLVLKTAHRGTVRVERMVVTFAEIAAACSAAGLPEGTVNLALVQAAALAQLNDMLTGEPPAVEPVEPAE